MSSGPGPVESAKVEVPIGYEQRADAAAASVLRRLLEVVQDNLEGAILGEDPEYLHQLRIAVRRSRTVLRQFRGVFPGRELPGFRADFRWLQRATGEARDLDVHLEDFDELAGLLPEETRPALEPVRFLLAQRRERSRAGLGSILHSRRASELFEDWERLLESLVELPIEDRPDARRSIGSLTGERVVKVYGTIVKRGAKLDEDSPGERFHDLRKMGKELRYLLDMIGVELFDEEAVGPLLRTMKTMQALLGRRQDREVQSTMLNGMAQSVGALPNGSRACLVMGMLLTRLHADEVAARQDFARAFELAVDPEAVEPRFRPEP